MNSETDNLMTKQVELSLNYHQKLALSVSLVPC